MSNLLSNLPKYNILLKTFKSDSAGHGCLQENNVLKSWVFLVL